MFIPALFVLANSENKKMPSADEWMNKILYIHTTEYYVAIKMNGVLVHAAT